MFYVYILQCKDNTYYTGYTNDLAKRLQTHNEGKGSKYTRGRLPVKIVFAETLASKSEAMQRENTIKKLTRKQKEKLIHTYQNRIS